MSVGGVPLRAFFCLRHGTTDWNREGRFQGRTDNPMCDEGIAQAFVAARRLQKHRIDRIVTSPRIRAAKTAEIVAASSAIPVAIDDGLAEPDFGYLEGQVITETMKTHNLTTVQDLITILPPETEPWPALARRGLRCVASWLAAHPQASILFVSHDGLMQAMFEALSGKWFHNRHGIPVRYAPTEKGWIVEEI
ncbi:MAG TPA: histidine phosphatase family protein [Bradyrhizobium sp.]|nr:histidine phosphatase family protein [Bradyrhizobium sp.]